MNSPTFGTLFVDSANGGTLLRWGRYNEAGSFQFVGQADVASRGTNRIGVTQQGGSIEISFNGRVVGTTTTSDAGGYVGLLSSLSAVAFERAVLTAL